MSAVCWGEDWTELQMDAEDRKRKAKWRAESRERARIAFPLADGQLAKLFVFVESQVAANGCDDTPRFATTWLSQQAPGTSRAVLAWLEANGGYCDCEIAANAQDHWQQNRELLPTDRGHPAG